MPEALKPYVIVTAVWLGGLYVAANAAYAILDSLGWVEARWTARRGIDQRYDPWSPGAIQALGVFYAAVALGWSYVALQATVGLFDRL